MLPIHCHVYSCVCVFCILFSCTAHLSAGKQTGWRAAGRGRSPNTHCWNTHCNTHCCTHSSLLNTLSYNCRSRTPLLGINRIISLLMTYINYKAATTTDHPLWNLIINKWTTHRWKMGLFSKGGHLKMSNFQSLFDLVSMKGSALTKWKSISTISVFLHSLGVL